MSDHVAALLLERRVTPEERIAIWATRSVETVVAVLGTLKAGACCVMLDESVPNQRRTHMLESTGVRLMVAPEQAAIPPMNIECVQLRHPTPDRECQPCATVYPDNLAFIFHTSGSTGTPKGVTLTHRSIVDAVEAVIAVKQVGPGDRWPLYKPVTFDVWCLEFFTAMLSGACLQVFPPAMTAPGPDLLRTLLDHQATVLWVPPSGLRVLPRERLPLIHTVVTGGEALPADLARHWARDRRMFNSYGLTECGLASTFHQVRSEEEEPVPIGTPLPGVTAHVVDDDLRPVAQGQQGELLIGGSLIARGYFDDPATTAERFVPDPAGGGGRACRSGDLVRLRSDGSLELIGRRDHQVKVSGVRVDLGEVEAALRAHPAVAEVAVVPAQRGDDTELAAHVACRIGMPVTAAELRDFLRERLPAAMVPARVVFHEALPHTAHDKVDRRALADTETPPDARPEPGPTVDDAMEAALGGVLGTMLRRAPVGPEENFFEHGIHSLLAARLVVIVQELFGVDIDVASVLRAPTVRELATLVRERRQTAATGSQ